MVRIDLVDIDDSDDPVLERVREIMTETGLSTKGDHWRIEANFPEVFEHRLGVRRTLWEEGTLAEETLEKIAVAVSAANGCRVCTGVFCSHLGDLGYDEDEVAAFVASVGDHELGDREDAILAFALQTLEEPKDVTDEMVERLRDDHGLSDQDLLQVVLVVNTISGYNRIVDAFDSEATYTVPGGLPGE